MVISEKVIDRVITHQFNSAEDATRDKNSIEISGFGKFVFNLAKANAEMVNGLLVISIPLSNEAKPKSITIK